MLFNTALLCLLATFAEALPNRRAVDPTVTISSGVLIGTATRVLNQPSNTGLVNAFIGVPFANNPPARFQPPTAPQAWPSPLTVQAQKPVCLQQFFSGDIGERAKRAFNNPIDQPAPAEDESCLYLSVYAPQGAGPTNLKPVLFWLFGGNLIFGGSSLYGYNGSSFAVNQDVVVVVPNYRTNIFGFSASPEVPLGSQNSGFLDQRFALDWVQKNIKAFGGDPTKVTIFGESAGGFSVKQLLAHPPSPLPFRAAIMESPALAALGNGPLNYQNVATKFGCTGQQSPLKCLQGVPARDIQKYINDNNLFFPPVADQTNSNYDTNVQINAGTFAKVPVLIGTNKNEFTVFENILGIDNSTAVADALVEALTFFAGKVTPELTAVLKTAVALLVPPFDPTANTELIDRLATDLIFTCPAYFLSKLLTQKQYSVWRYRFDAAFPNTQFFPNAGAYHTSEISSVWGTFPLANAYGKATPDQISLSAYNQKTWANFAKNPSAGPAWLKFGANNGVDLGVLGGVNRPGGESTESSAPSNTKCELFYQAVLTLADLKY